MDTLTILTRTRRALKSMCPITLLALLVLPTWTQTAHADSVPTFVAHATIDIFANPGEIDSDTTFQGPGINVEGTGNAECDWCGNFLTPGSSLNPSLSDIDLSFGPGGTLTFGGQQFDCQFSVNCELGPAAINALKSFTFPTNDQSFTVAVPAMIPGPLSGVAGTQSFNVQTPPGKLVLNFAFNDLPFPSYELDSAEFSTSSAPEPGTLGLLAAGLAAIFGVRKKRKLL